MFGNQKRHHRTIAREAAILGHLGNVTAPVSFDHLLESLFDTSTNQLRSAIKVLLKAEQIRKQPGKGKQNLYSIVGEDETN